MKNKIRALKQKRSGTLIAVILVVLFLIFAGYIIISSGAGSTPREKVTKALSYLKGDPLVGLVQVSPNGSSVRIGIRADRFKSVDTFASAVIKRIVKVQPRFRLEIFSQQKNETLFSIDLTEN